MNSSIEQILKSVLEITKQDIENIIYKGCRKEGDG